MQQLGRSHTYEVNLVVEQDVYLHLCGQEIEKIMKNSHGQYVILKIYMHETISRI